MLASYGCYILADMLTTAKYARVHWFSRLEFAVIAVALNLYYAASSAGVSVLWSHISGWQAGRVMIRAGILCLVLVVSSLWLSRAWRNDAPVFARW